MRRAPLIVAAFAALACLAAAGAPFLTSQARAGAAYPKAFTTTDDASAAHALVLSKDGIHCLQIVANLRAEPPEQPVVILLGGSSARESTIDDVNWAAQIVRKGGPTTVLAYNLGSKHDTFEVDLEVAKLLPKGMPAIVYIGINIGRFCNSSSQPTLSLPVPKIPAPAYYQHVYSKERIQSASLKRYYVRYWLTKRRPEFKRHYSYNIGVVESVVKTCIRRGLRPVLVDLPRDLPIIGHSFDAQVATYNAGCKRVAANNHIPWLTFVAAAGFVDHDFFDIFHLVEPGRSKYQHLLSEKTVTWLGKYGLNPEPTPTPTPSPSPTETPVPTPTPTETPAL